MFKLAIQYRRWGFRGRDRTEQDLINLNLTRQQAAEIICGLTPANYVSGPSPDDVDATKSVWVFGHQHERTEVYIKLRLNEGSGQQLPHGIVWSFHAADHPMTYPMRGGGA